MSLNRRSLITGLISLVAAPAIVRAGSLMPVKMLEPARLVGRSGIYVRMDDGWESRWGIVRPLMDGSYISSVGIGDATAWPSMHVRS